MPTVATKLPLICPEATVTLDGTVMLTLSLARARVKPAPEATLVKVTVQVEVPGAFTVAGEQLKLPGWAATVRPIAATCVIPFREAVTVAF